MALSASLMTQLSVLCMVRGLFSNIDANSGRTKVSSGCCKNICSAGFYCSIYTFFVCESSSGTSICFCINLRKISFSSSSISRIISCLSYSFVKLTIFYFKGIVTSYNDEFFCSVKFCGIFSKVSLIFISGFLHSLGLVSLGNYGGKGRDQNTREDCDNGDDNDELYDSKALFVEFFHC